MSRPVTVGGLLWRGVPRLVLNSLGPVGAFYIGSRLGGTLAGMALATAVSMTLWAWERRAGRPGLLARLALFLVLIQAAAGGLTGSAFAYFAPKAAADIVEGLVCYVSCLTRWPLAAILGRELVALPRSLGDAPAVRRMFVGITLVWGTYFTLRGIVTMSVLATGSTDTYLLVRALIDAPIVIPLAAGSLAYGLRRLRELAEPALPLGESAA